MTCMSRKWAKGRESNPVQGETLYCFLASVTECWWKRKWDQRAGSFGCSPGDATFPGRESPEVSLGRAPRGQSGRDTTEASPKKGRSRPQGSLSCSCKEPRSWAGPAVLNYREGRGPGFGIQHQPVTGLGCPLGAGAVWQAGPRGPGRFPGGGAAWPSQQQGR